MPEQEDIIKKLKRRANQLLLDKEVPAGKMDVVRSLMNNHDLLPNEKYSTIISLLETCPDKQVRQQKMKRVEIVQSKVVQKKPPSTMRKISDERYDALEKSSIFVSSLFDKYKNLKLFKKRWLIHANNRFGIGIKKRLIPTKRCLSVIRDVVNLQERILSQLDSVLIAILNNDEMDDPTVFNYLRVFRRWMVQSPLIEYQYDALKWMNRKSFEAELKTFVITFFSFQKLSVEERENIILTVETVLRNFKDLKKLEIKGDEQEGEKSEKEKENLRREKLVHDYIMFLRSFLPTSIRSESMVSEALKNKYGIASYPDFLLILMEALVFWKEIDLSDLDYYFEIEAPVISKYEWDYSVLELKKVGKDPESRKQKKIEKLKQKLVPYEELYRFLSLKISGQYVVERAFEDQWKIVDKRQRDFETVYNGDFFNFIDGCINFFNNCCIYFINGSKIFFDLQNSKHVEGCIFSPTYFYDNLQGFSQILNEIHYSRTNNPTLMLSKDEITKLVKGQSSSTSSIGRLISTIGEFFYRLGTELNEIYTMHVKWVTAETDSRGMNDAVERPLERQYMADAQESGLPLPYYNYHIIGFEQTNTLSKNLLKRNALGQTVESVISSLIAFSYQLAGECLNRDLERDLEERKEILRELKSMTGK